MTSLSGEGMKNKKVRKLKMWMVTGRSGGLRSLWPSRWKAKEEVDTTLFIGHKIISVEVIIKK